MKKLITIVLLAAISVLLGCSLPGTPNKPELPEELEIAIESPYNVMVFKDKASNAIVLSWEDSNFGNYYEIERSVEGGTFLLLTKEPINIKHYRDTTYPPDKRLIYRVRAVRGPMVSEYSTPLFSIVIPLEEISVQHTYATKLEVKDAILISWDPLDNVEINPSYRIRRYDSRESGEKTPNVGFIEFIPTPEDLARTINGKLCFTDKTIIDHTPYFYSIHWTNLLNNQEGLPGNVVLGMGSEYDYCDSEPNNSIDDIDISQSFLPLPNQKLIIYDYLHPKDKDIDWYNYVGNPCSLEVTVTFENGFNLAENLEFSFLHNGKSYPCGTINNSYPFDNVFIFPKEQFDTNSVIEEPMIVSANKILNGEFSGGTSNWNLNNYDGGSATMNTNNSMLNILIDNGGTLEWHVQLTQPGILIENGKSYLVEFDARTGFYNRTIQASIGQSVDPYHSYSGYESISLTSSFQHFSFTFTMTNPNDSNSRIEFNLGLDDVNVFLDNIHLYEIEQQDTEIEPAVQFCIKPKQNNQNIYGMYRLSIDQK